MDFKAHVTHSEGAKASLWFHSDSTLSKGYSILIGNPADDRRRSGSLAFVRNLYKVTDANITSLADNLPNYPEGSEPIDERDDALIRLQQRSRSIFRQAPHDFPLQ